MEPSSNALGPTKANATRTRLQAALAAPVAHALGLYNRVTGLLPCVLLMSLVFSALGAARGHPLARATARPQRGDLELRQQRDHHLGRVLADLRARRPLDHRWVLRTRRLGLRVAHGVVVGVSRGAITGCIAAMIRGGLAIIQHAATRMLLALSGALPLVIVALLEEALRVGNTAPTSNTVPMTPVTAETNKSVVRIARLTER